MNAPPDAVDLWTSTLAGVERQNPALAGALLRVAIVHWFDEPMLAALQPIVPPTIGRPHESVPADLLFVLLEDLPFVEPYRAGRLRLHLRIREALLAQLLVRDAAFVSAADRAAAECLAQARSDGRPHDNDELLECAYHLLAVDPVAGIDWVNQVYEDVSVTPAALDRLMQYVDELRGENRLPAAAAEYAGLWSIWTAAAAGDFRRVRELAGPALAELSPDHALVPEIRYEEASACVQLGERDAAAGIATDLAEHSADLRLAVMATVLLGDLATAEEALEHYARALTHLLGSPDDADPSDCLDVTRWLIEAGLIESEDPDGGKQETDAVIVALRGDDPDEQADVYHLADSLFGYVWLRIGETEAGRRRPVEARAWQRLAVELFNAIGNGLGYQQAVRALQRQAASYGNARELHELVDSLRALVEWARSVGAAKVEFEALLDLGEVHGRLAELTEAVTAYDAAAALADRIGDRIGQADTAQRLAEIAIVRKRLDEADRFLATADRLLRLEDPYRADLLGLTAGDRWAAEAQWDRADREYRRALDAAAGRANAFDEASVLLAMARAAKAAPDLTEARGRIERAERVSGEADPLLLAEVLAEKADILRRLHDDTAEQVEAHLAELAAELNLESMLARLAYERANRASLRFDLLEARHGYEQALNWYRQLDDQASVFDCLTGLTYVLLDLHRPEEARVSAEEAVAVAERSNEPSWRSAAVQVLANVKIEIGEGAEAVEMLLAQERQTPDDADVSGNLGWVYFRTHNYVESLRWSERALELQPTDAYSYRNIGHALLCLGRVDEAKAAYHKAIEGRQLDEKNFRETLAELETIRVENPGLAAVAEIAELFRAEQAKLDA